MSERGLYLLMDWVRLLMQKEQAFWPKMDCLLSIGQLALDCCIMDSPDRRIYTTDAATKLKKIRVKFLDAWCRCNLMQHWMCVNCSFYECFIFIYLFIFGFRNKSHYFEHSRNCIAKSLHLHLSSIKLSI